MLLKPTGYDIRNKNTDAGLMVLIPYYRLQQKQQRRLMCNTFF